MRTSIGVCAALALAAGLAWPVQAQAQTKDEIVRSLQTQGHAQGQAQGQTRGLTRGLTRGVAPAGGGMSAQHRGLVNSLKGKATRQITVEERTEIAKVAKENDLPSVDLEIYFDYDSAAITQAAMPRLTALGQALSDAKLKGSTFLVAGHTDARGGNDYNQSLSERRAEAVKQFLMQTFQIDPKGLIAVGYGEEQLKHVAAPEDDENRRVQVINLAVN